MLKKRLEYLRYHKSCLQIAEMVQTHEQRTMVLHIAETWMRLAETVQKDTDVHTSSRTLH
jgi:hypothetical protein